jgi:hypothetical protein
MLVQRARACGVAVTAVTVVALVCGAPTAYATTVVGQAVVGDQGSSCGGGSWLQIAAPGDSYAVPLDGVLTSWTSGAWGGADAQLQMIVARPTSSGYVVVGKTPFVMLPSSPAPQTTYAADIPVKAGDVLGVGALGTTTHCLASTDVGYSYANAGVDDPTIGTTLPLFTFSGSAVSVSATEDLACSTTIAGSVPGALKVGSGQSLCLTSGATISGGVTVEPGGSLTLAGAQVSGGVTSKGASSVSICGSTVNGPVKITTTAGMVSVGDDDAMCAGNRLRGTLSVSDNQGGVEVFGNAIASTATVTGNLGASPPSSDAVPEIEQNTIGGALLCSANAPTPTNDGLANTVAGARTGQCANL